MASRRSSRSDASDTGAAAGSAGARLVLAFELRQKDLSAVVIADASAEAIYADRVTFDADFPEHLTKNGVYSAPKTEEHGPSSLMPVEMIVKALDLLLDRLHSAPHIHLSQVRAIGIAAVSPLAVFLAPQAAGQLASLHPSRRLHKQLGHDFFSVPFSSTPQDESTTSELLAIERALETACLPREASAEQATGFSFHLGTPGTDLVTKAKLRERRKLLHAALARRLGAVPHLAGFAAQLLKVRRGRAVGFVGEPGKGPAAWSNTAHITTAGGLLRALLVGRFMGLAPADAAATGVYNPHEADWDALLLGIVSGDQEAGLRRMLAPVEAADAPLDAHASTWLVRRYGFAEDCVVAPALPLFVAAFIGLSPHATDGGVSFGETDVLVVPVRSFLADARHQLLPNPLAAQDAAMPQWLAVVRWPGGGVARQIIRDVYTNGRWSVFRQLVNAVSVGGQVSLDDKRYALFDGAAKAFYKFEHGARVAELTDVRANARCVVEGQVLAMRAAASRLAHADDELFDAGRRHGSAASALGFDAHEWGRLPQRWLAWGKASANESIAELFSLALGAPLLCHQTDVEAARSATDGSAESKQPARGARPHSAASSAATSSTASNASPSRAALGAALLARSHLPEHANDVATPTQLTSQLQASHSTRAPSTRRHRALTALQERSEEHISSDSLRVPPQRWGVDGRQRAATISDAGVTVSKRGNIPIDEAQAGSSWGGSGYSTPYNDAADVRAAETCDGTMRGEDAALGLVQVAAPDRDFFHVYGSLLPEHARLCARIDAERSV